METPSHHPPADGTLTGPPAGGSAGTRLPVPPPPDDPTREAGATPPFAGAVAPAPADPEGFRLLHVLGAGGMGVVYAAVQLGLNRTVAVKFLRAGPYLRPDQLARFRTEAEAVARVPHPNIVQVFEAGESHGRPYLALEFVPGGSLSDRLKDGPLPPRAAAELLRPIAAGVHAAHRAGIVHRDLKPHNVLLAPDGTPKVTDFGLAKPLPDASGNTPLATGATATGAILGTPAYMAPEQAEGTPDAVGPPADVWALGAVLYECLTGRPPFQAATAIETIDLVRAADPVPPRRLVPAVPRDLETICLKCLRKPPAQRYASAAAVAADLDRFLAGRPIVARPVGRAERVAKLARRNPGAAALAGVLAAVSAVSLGVILWQWSEAVFQRNRAVEKAAAEAAARDEAEANLYFGKIAAAAADWQVGNAADADRHLDDCPPDRRGWEWRYLRRLCRPPLRTVVPAGEAAGPIVAGADGRRVAVASLHRGLSVWDADTGRLVGRRPGKFSTFPSLAFTADGGAVVAALWPDPPADAAILGDARVFAWEPDTGRERWRWQAPVHREEVYVVSPEAVARYGWKDGPRSGHLTVYDPATGAVRFSAQAHPRAAGLLPPFFDRTGRWLVTAGPDGPGVAVKLWDARTGAGKVVATLPRVRELTVGPGGDLVAVGDDAALRVYDAAAGRELYRRPAAEAAMALEFGPGGRLAGYWPGDVPGMRVWDARTGRELARLPGRPDPPGPFAFLSESRLAVTSELAAGSPVWAWDAAPGGAARMISRDGDLQAHAFAPDGRTLAVGGNWKAGDRHPIELYDLVTGAAVRRLAGHASGLRDLAFSPDGTRLASGADDGTARVWDVASGAELAALPVGAGAPPGLGTVGRVAFRDGGAKLLTVRKDGLFQLWDLAAKAAGPPLYHERAESDVEFHPDGRRAALVVDRRAVKWIDLTTGQVLSETARSREVAVEMVRISPDGLTYLLNEAALVGHPTPADWRFRLELREVETGRVLRAWDQFRGGATGEFTPDGRVIANGWWDHRYWVLDPGTGRPVLTLPGRYQGFGHFAVSRDGRWVVAGTHQTGYTGARNALAVFDARPLDAAK